MNMALILKSANRRLPRHHRRLMVGALPRTRESEERPLGPQRGIPTHASRLHRRSPLRALSILARKFNPPLPLLPFPTHTIPSNLPHHTL